MKGKILSMFFTSIFVSGAFLLNASASMDSRLVEVNGEMVSFSSIKSELCNSDVANVKFSDPISVNGVNIELYCTFENREEAVENLFDKYPNAFDYLYENYDLPSLITPDNWREFLNAINSSYEDDNNITQNLSRELSAIRAFLDIYENNEINSEILDLANLYNTPVYFRGLNDNKLIENRLDELIPNYSDNFGTITPLFSGNPNARVGASLNVEKAVEYATTYATSPNKNDYDYFSGGDCANFTSQILEYSGVKQVTSDSIYSGWWHKVSTGWFGIKTHTHSHSWTLADVFARYMGVTVKTKSLTSWSRDLRAGDFIAADFNADGSWDHMGFVTKANGTPKTYKNGSTTYNYSDIKVAQHTSNYHAWTSSSTNGWEELVADGAYYGRIRG